MNEIEARRRGRARVRAVAISATTACVLATARLAVALPGITSVPAAHGGRVELTSRPGLTTFTVTLPA